MYMFILDIKLFKVDMHKMHWDAYFDECRFLTKNMKNFNCVCQVTFYFYTYILYFDLDFLAYLTFMKKMNSWASKLVYKQWNICRDYKSLENKGSGA